MHWTCSHLAHQCNMDAPPLRQTPCPDHHMLPRVALNSALQRHETERLCNLQVATPRDPASARLGESLYMFLPRSVVGNLRDGVVMELDRLRARHLPFFCLQNRCAVVLPSPGNACLYIVILVLCCVCMLCSSQDCTNQHLYCMGWSFPIVTVFAALHVSIWSDQGAKMCLAGTASPELSTMPIN